jgi:hypothetical protein
VVVLMHAVRQQRHNGMGAAPDLVDVQHTMLRMCLKLLQLYVHHAPGFVGGNPVRPVWLVGGDIVCRVGSPSVIIMLCVGGYYPSCTPAATAEAEAVFVYMSSLMFADSCRMVCCNTQAGTAPVVTPQLAFLSQPLPNILFSLLIVHTACDS